MTAPLVAQLIRELREQPPFISIRAAAGAAGLSEARWRQIESGFRTFRGERYAETGPPQTVARMVFVVGGTAGQLRELGQDDAAAELAAMERDAQELLAQMPPRQRQVIARKMRRDTSSS